MTLYQEPEYLAHLNAWIDHLNIDEEDDLMDEDD